MSKLTQTIDETGTAAAVGFAGRALEKSSLGGGGVVGDDWWLLPAVVFAGAVALGAQRRKRVRRLGRPVGALAGYLLARRLHVRRLEDRLTTDPES